jgi:hypothetical protein
MEFIETANCAAVFDAIGSCFNASASYNFEGSLCLSEGNEVLRNSRGSIFTMQSGISLAQSPLKKR